MIEKNAIKKKPSQERLTPFYAVNVNYSLTINPNDNNQGLMGKCPLTRMAIIKQNITSILEKDNKDIAYLLHVDISEPRVCNENMYPRVHFHGVITFRTNAAILNWQLFILRKLSRISQVKIDSIDDMDYWVKYCRKYDSITGIRPIQHKMAFRSEDNGKDRI